MENVPDAPEPAIADYGIISFLLNNRWVGGEQCRMRRFSFGVRGSVCALSAYLDYTLFEPVAWSPAVAASGGTKPGAPTDRMTRLKYMGWKTAEALKESIRLQDLPADFLDKAPFTLDGKHRVIGNGVPLPMGRAIAKAVKEAVCKL